MTLLDCCLGQSLQVVALSARMNDSKGTCRISITRVFEEQSAHSRVAVGGDISTECSMSTFLTWHGDLHWFCDLQRHDSVPLG